MKRNSYFVLIAGGAYTYLFYQQTAGINFFIFSILIVVLAWYSNRQVIKSLSWLGVAAGTLLTGLAAFFWGGVFTVTVNIVSVMLLAALTHTPIASLFVALLHSVYSLPLALPLLIKNLQSDDPAEAAKFDAVVRKIVLTVLPVVVVVMFFMLYRSANPLFENVTNKIDFDFISQGWIIFTAFGMYLMFVFFTQQTIAALDAADKNNTDTLPYTSIEQRSSTFIASFLSHNSEVYTGVLLLGLLNLLVLSVNGIDVYYLYILQQLPKGLSFSDYVHDGTNGLIVSIVFAIAVILFYFRGHLNFSTSNKTAKLLATGWVVQNIVLVVTTAQRNWFYIAEYGLTHKRIGVCIFLWLCVAGLALTLIKVVKVKANWFLFRKNAWVVYITLVVVALINTDALIARHNVQLAWQNGKPVDGYYLNSLSNNTLVALFECYSVDKTLPENKRVFSSYLVSQMKSRYYAVLNREENWQSYNYNTYLINSKVPAIIKSDEYLNKPER